MLELHRYIGEGLFAIYLIVIGVVIIMGRRGRTVPKIVVGLAHGLLALQVAFGVILLAEVPGRVVWYHPVLGIAALLALGLTPVFRSRFGETTGLVVTLAVVAFLSLAAYLVAAG